MLLDHQHLSNPSALSPLSAHLHYHSDIAPTTSQASYTAWRISWTFIYWKNSFFFFRQCAKIKKILFTCLYNYNLYYFEYTVKSRLAIDCIKRWRSECCDTTGILLANVIANRLGIQCKLKKRQASPHGSTVWTAGMDTLSIYDWKRLSKQWDSDKVQGLIA